MSEGGRGEVTGRISVLIAEDHPVVRQGLAALLAAAADIEVAGAVADGEQAVEAYARLLPDVCLFDLKMPGMGGVAAITRIRARFPAARFIVLTTYDGDEDIFRALEAGARAYLLKGMELEELLAAIRTVHAGRAMIPPAIAGKLAERVSADVLTARELAVLELIVAGRPNREIASRLHISEATVKSHVNSILSKLNVADRTQAAVTALQRGIVHLP